jgi:hypothetical protein
MDGSLDRYSQVVITTVRDGNEDKKTSAVKTTASLCLVSRLRVCVIACTGCRELKGKDGMLSGSLKEVLMRTNDGDG